MTTYYLYIKRCSHCELKYFGVTIRNPFIYRGSGKYWNAHLKSHKCKHDTIEVFGFDDFELCQEFAILFSIEHDIVASDQWANLKEETGGAGGRPSFETRFLMRAAKLGKKHSEEHARNIGLGNTGKKRSVQFSLNQSNMQKENNWNLGRKHTQESSDKKSKALIGRVITQEHRNNIGKAITGENHWAYDHTIRNWYHKQYGSFIGTTYELSHQYPELKLSTSHLTGVYNSTRNQHKGWRLVPQEQPLVNTLPI